MKAVLEYEGEANNPVAIFVKAGNRGDFSDAEAWLEMMEKSNLSPYTYDEGVAQEIYHAVKEQYSGLFEALEQRLNSWLSNMKP